MFGQEHTIRLPAGTIRYREAGSGPPIVFIHGYLVDGRLWDGVAEALADRYRCLVPDWPFGSHRTALESGTDLTPPGVATIVEDFLAALELADVTLVGNDSGGAMCQVTVARRPERIGRLVLTNCDTHENFPPGIFKLLPPLAKLPGVTTALAQPLRFPAVTGFAYRPFARKPIPAELTTSWAEPARTDAGVRRDMRAFTIGMHRRHTLAAAASLRGSEFPLLLAWAPGDKYFPLRYAERLAGEVGGAKLVEIPGAGTFVPLDQPEAVATHIADFAPKL